MIIVGNFHVAYQSLPIAVPTCDVREGSTLYKICTYLVWVEGLIFPPNNNFYNNCIILAIINRLSVLFIIFFSISMDAVLIKLRDRQVFDCLHFVSFDKICMNIGYLFCGLVSVFLYFADVLVALFKSLHV